MKRYFLIGIGGSGLSAIARLLLEAGCYVAGSDQAASPVTDALERQGAQIYIGHRAEQVAGSDVVIQSSAIPENNPEISGARRLGIPVQKRSAFLEEFLKDRRVIAVAGTAGKTTTTAMIAWLLTCLGMDPGYLIGGVSKNLHSNSHYGRGDYFVIEADEYDRMFLGLHPVLEVITNVEHDHPDMFPTTADYHAAFNEFITQLQPEGTLLAGEDIPSKLEAAQKVKRCCTYGLHETCDYELRSMAQKSDGGLDLSIFRHIDRNSITGIHASLQVPGQHNALNALAALAVTDLLGSSARQAAQFLGEFAGVERRFEKAGTANEILFIDDYAHHPAKIRSTLQAARSAFANRRIWAVWQPHTYSRTETFFEDFAGSFSDADQIVITEVYAARENADGFSAAQFLAPLSQAIFTPALAQAEDYLFTHLQPGDVMIMLSAGDANQIIPRLISRFQQTAPGSHTGASPAERMTR